MSTHLPKHILPIRVEDHILPTNFLTKRGTLAKLAKYGSGKMCLRQKLSLLLQPTISRKNK